MTTPFFSRQLLVRVGARRFEGVQMLAEVARAVDEDTPTATIEFWNLAPDTIGQLLQVGRVGITPQPVFIQAGYEGNVGVLFDGVVSGQPEQRREQLNTITKIRALPALRHQAKLGGVSNRSYRGPVNVRRILLDIVGLDMGLALGGLDVIPAGAVKVDFVAAGQSTTALNRVLQGLGVDWHEEHGIIKFTKEQPQNPFATRLTPQTGLIGSPQRISLGGGVEQQGVEAVSMLTPGRRAGRHRYA